MIVIYYPRKVVPAGQSKRQAFQSSLEDIWKGARVFIYLLMRAVCKMSLAVLVDWFGCWEGMAVTLRNVRKKPFACIDQSTVIERIINLIDCVEGLLLSSSLASSRRSPLNVSPPAKQMDPLPSSRTQYLQESHPRSR